MTWGWGGTEKTARTGCSMCAGKGEIILSDGSAICNRCDGLGVEEYTSSRGGSGEKTCSKCYGVGVIKPDDLKRY